MESMMHESAMDTLEEDMDLRGADLLEAEGGEPVLNMAYVLSRIDQILRDKAHIREAIAAVSKMEASQPSLNAPPDTSRAEAIGSIVEAREVTNQRLLGILDQMYRDLRPERAASAETGNRESEQVQQIRALRELTQDMSDEYASELLADALGKIL